ncbi:MAG: hypothetical protein WDM81_17065 [Rhizomicrobium sp.]
MLTGETGAGKSILLDALGLAAGGRGGGRAAVRPGAAQGSATALFEPARSNPAFALLAEQAIPAETEIVLRRTLAQDGRTRAFINDEPVGVGLLRDIGAALLEVHGQADDRGLFDVATHRGLLDTFAGHDALLRETALAFATFDGARKALADLKAEAAAAAADADYIKHAAEELTALAPEEGEESRLARSAPCCPTPPVSPRTWSPPPISWPAIAAAATDDFGRSQTSLPHERSGAQGGCVGRGRLGPGLQCRRGSAARTRSAADQARYRARPARESRGSHPRSAGGGAQIRRRGRCLAEAGGGFSLQARRDRRRRRTGQGSGSGGRRGPHRVPAVRREALQIARRGGAQARSRRRRRTGAAQARPCQIPRRV